MSRRYAIFDSASLGANLSVEQSGEVLAVSAASQNINRTARGDIGVTGDVHYFEVAFWSDTDTLANRACVGVVTSDASLSTYVGGDAYGVGYRVAEGQIHNGGVSAASVSVGAKESIVGVLLDLQNEVVVFYLDGEQIGSYDISGTGFFGATWYLAVSLGSGTEADLKAILVTGQRAFQHPNALSEGFYEIADTIAAQFIATEDFTTHPSDTPANQRFDAVVPLSGVSAEVSLKLDFWPWGGDSVTVPSVASITLLNPTGDFDDLAGDVRDVPVYAYWVEDGQPFSSAESIGQFVVERVDVLDDTRVRIVMKDNSAQLDTPLQNKLFLPFVSESAANRTYPILLGAVYSAPGILYDEFNLRIKLHDDTLLGIGVVRTSGDPLSLASSPEDYTITDDWQGIELANNPNGKVTIDASSVGGDVPTPPTNLAPANLAAWDDSLNVTESGGTYTLGDGGQSFGNVEAYLKATGVLTAGQTYRYRIVISDKSGVFGSGQLARLEIAGGELKSTTPWKVFSETGDYSGTFKTFGQTDFVLRMVGTDSTQDFIDLSATISLYEVSNAEVTSDNLLPIDFEEFAYQILEVRGPFSTDQWDRTSAAAIDTDTSYAGGGYYTDQQVSVREAMQRALNSYTACMAQDRSGVFQFYRLQAPEDRSAESQGTIDGSSILMPGLKIEPDNAPGLTNSFACKRNELVLDPTDIVEDYADVPIATRRILGEQYREVVHTAGRFAAAYPHAISAPPLETWFNDPADAQTEVDRIRAIYATQRRFFTVDVKIEDAGQYDIDQIWLLEYDRYGLDEGKYVCVVGISEDHINRRATLRLWG